MPRRRANANRKSSVRTRCFCQPKSDGKCLPNCGYYLPPTTDDIDFPPLPEHLATLSPSLQSDFKRLSANPSAPELSTFLKDKNLLLKWKDEWCLNPPSFLVFTSKDVEYLQGNRRCLICGSKGFKDSVNKPDVSAKKHYFDQHGVNRDAYTAAAKRIVDAMPAELKQRKSKSKKALKRGSFIPYEHPSTSHCSSKAPRIGSSMHQDRPLESSPEDDISVDNKFLNWFLPNDIVAADAYCPYYMGSTQGGQTPSEHSSYFTPDTLRSHSRTSSFESSLDYAPVAGTSHKRRRDEDDDDEQAQRDERLRTRQNWLKTPYVYSNPLEDTENEALAAVGSGDLDVVYIPPELGGAFGFGPCVDNNSSSAPLVGANSTDASWEYFPFAALQNGDSAACGSSENWTACFDGSKGYGDYPPMSATISGPLETPSVSSGHQNLDCSTILYPSSYELASLPHTPYGNSHQLQLPNPSHDTDPSTLDDGPYIWMVNDVVPIEALVHTHHVQPLTTLITPNPISVSGFYPPEWAQRGYGEEDE
ncbi:hypothetical protein DL96DRAFT_1685647 [Flagelloscypha sp. PMI_526]|nr:hypothetical protein DL96DRAFT_1685647 [Flagelloscypha sp. PMI_526]